LPSTAISAVALSPRLAGPTGAIGVAALSTALFAPVRGGDAVPPEAAPALAMPFLAMLVAGATYLEVVPPVSAACFAAAPVAAVVPRRPLGTVAVVALIAAGLLLAGR